MKTKIRNTKECERSRAAGGGVEELRKMQVEGGRAGEVVKSGRERERRGGSYVVVYRVAESRYNNLTQGRVLNENLV